MTFAFDPTSEAPRQRHLRPVEAAIAFDSGEPPPRHEKVDALSEDYGAQVFAQRYSGKLLYCHDEGVWFGFDGAIWRREKTDRPLHFAREVAREIHGAENTRARVSGGKTVYARGVEKFAAADPVFARTSEHWDRDPFLLGTPEGTVDLRTGQLRPAKPDDGITKAVAVAPAPLADCPLWLRFLDDVTGGDGGLARFLRQWAGYALTGDTREQKLVFVYGPGGNGKGVWLNTVAEILADYAATAAMDTFEASRDGRHPADLAMLRGARLVTASETEEGRSWAEARIKQMTGGDAITARFMRQDFFTYRPQFKLTIIGNHKPVLHNVDDAARRRFNIVPFTHMPATPDPDLVEKLKAEWPAILRWMIDGCIDWQENGLIQPPLVTAATAEYFSDQDLFAQWLDEFCEPEIGNEFRVEAIKDLYDSWRSFAAQSGEIPGSKKAFSDQMQRRGFPPHRTAGKRMLRYVRLKFPAMTDDRL